MLVKLLATDLLQRKVWWWWFRGCVAVIFVVSGFGLLFSWQQAAELVRVHIYHYDHTDAVSHADAAGGSAVFCLLPQGGGDGGGYI